MQREYVKLHYDISKGDFIKAGEASSNIKRAFLQLGINSDIIKRVCVVCYEAEMNIVIHSLGGYIEACIFEDRVEIYAKDKGPGIENIELAMQEGFSTAPETAREMGFGAGMGLPNMKKCSDSFEICSEAGKYTNVNMTIKFS